MKDSLTRIVRLDQGRWHTLHWFTRWLVMIRAPVLIMTLSSALTGIVLALAAHAWHWDRALALLLGLSMAHATNNLINDWVDGRMGIDRDNYFRRQYGTHVLEDGLVTPVQFWAVTAITAGIAVACAAYLIFLMGSTVLVLTATGAFFVLFYTWPMKHLALGEIAVLLVWGPLITAGAYFVLAETITVDILVLSVITGIGPTLVIFGKHIDKYPHDTAAKIRTLPVVLGHARSRQVSFLLVALQWLCLIWVVLRQDYYFLSLCLLALPSCWQLCVSLKTAAPEEKPESFAADVWPLWYAAFAFRYSRNFGLAFGQICRFTHKLNSMLLRDNLTKGQERR